MGRTRRKKSTEGRRRAGPPRKRRGPGLFTRLGWLLTWLGFLAVESFLRLLPLDAVFLSGRAAGRLAWLVTPRYRRLARRNLDIVFGGEMSPEELDALCREHFARLGGNLLCSLKIPTMSQEAVSARIDREGFEHTERAVAAGRGVVCALCHMGNWEVLSQIPWVGAGSPTATLFQRLGNPWLNAHVVQMRSRRGFRLFDRHDGFHGPVQFLRGNGVLGVLVDQHAGDGGVWVPLFGRLASTTNLAALLSLRTGAPVLPHALYTVGRARWRMVVGPPISADGMDAAAMTAELNRVLEPMIRRQPADWFWVHNRWKTPRPNFLLARYKRGIALPAGRSVESLKRFEILVRAPNWLGDACMALPAVRAIKAGRTDARVTVLTTARLGEFWRAVPEIDAVIEKDRGDRRDGVKAVRALIREAGIRYDVAILLTGSLRSAFELRGIDRIVGYRGRWRSWFVDQIVPEPEPGPVRHHVNHFLRIAENTGADITSPNLFKPLTPSPAIGKSDPPREAHGGLFIGLVPGAEYGPAKRWPGENFAAVARKVTEKTGARWVVFGTSADAGTAAAIVSGLDGNARDLTGTTTLGDLARELVRCRLLLTNDTGTMHLASALGVPVVAVFGSTEPAWTGPLGNGHAVIRHHVECSPCFQRECPLETGRYRCFDAITVDEVAARVLELIAAR